ncbi:MAG: hypothetical protein D3904_00570 [Candidatus Electrothrix sp. EH2]|nr:hypothetical protein [Candidatus Electrothrix sp. EH2]
MSYIEDFLLELSRLDIKVWVENEKLCCDMPKGCLTDELQAQLVERKSEIIQFLSKKKIFDQAIPSLPAGKIAPLSLTQQRLWFLEQLEGQRSTYNIPAALRLFGQINISVLQQSLQWVVERHESLRMYFPTADGQARVAVAEKLSAPIIRDLRSLSAAEQRSAVRSRTDRHAVEPFDLGTGPLFRAELLLLGEDETVLLLNMHHIISDGWSIGVFIRDWRHAYDAFVRDERPGLPPLEIQYGDYAAWQRSWLRGGLLQQQLDYWKNQLTGIAERLELPADHPRPPQQSYRGAHYHRPLSATLSQNLRKLSHQTGMSLFMTLLTGFYILLSRYSGQEDICVGSPIANRTHSQTEYLIGFFVNTLVLRGQIHSEQSVNELLQTVRRTCLEAYSHQDIPFEMLVEQLRPARSLSHNPLFQVMLVLQNQETVELTLPGLDINTLETAYPVAKFDLTLYTEERNGQLHCTWEYATDLFADRTVACMADHFEHLLTAMLADLDQSIGQLPMLTNQQVQQLITWNNTEKDCPNKTIIRLFEQQAKKTPDNIAVISGCQQLTYQQLNEKANQLAHHLITLIKQKGLTLNDLLIAISVEPSLDMMIGLLGILKAGCAYVPIAPEYPTARIHYMLEDSVAPLLLTQSHLQNQLSI